MVQDNFLAWMTLSPATWTAIAAFLTAAGIVLAGIPLWISFCQKREAVQPIRSTEVSELSGLHQHKSRTPTMGGVVLLGAIFFSALTWGNFLGSSWWMIAVPTLLMGLLGARDDWLKIGVKSFRGVSPKQKLIFQIVVGALLAASVLLHLYWIQPEISAQPLFIPWVGLIGLSGIAGIVALALLAIFTFVGGTNAVNLTDGLDGLSSGLLSIVFLFIGVLALNHCDWATAETRANIMIWASSALGSCTAFLRYNWHPARIFMGDTGSMGLGGCVSAMVISLRIEMLFAILAGCFVIETLSVMLQVWSFQSRGRRIFRCAPIHHHFEMGGTAEKTVVTGFWAAGLVLAILAGWAVI